MCHGFSNVLIQKLNVTLYNLRSFPFPALFLSILILNIYNTSDFCPEQNHFQNAGSARDQLVSHDKKFVGKIDTNLAS